MRNPLFDGRRDNVREEVVIQSLGSAVADPTPRYLLGPPPPSDVLRLALALPTSVTWLRSRAAEAGR